MTYVSSQVILQLKKRSRLTHNQLFHMIKIITVTLVKCERDVILHVRRPKSLTKLNSQTFITKEHSTKYVYLCREING